MPIYTVEMDGRQYDIEGDRPPSEAEARAAIGSHSNSQTPKQATPPPAAATMGMRAPDTATDRAPSGKLIDLLPRRPEQQRDMRQMVDAMPLGTPAPVSAVASGVKAVPGLVARAAGISKARAITNIGEASQAAQGAAVGTEGVGNIGLRAMELQQAGGRMPRVITQLMQRVTNPKLGEMTFEEARDFYSNISRLSANEFGTLNPVMQRQVGMMKAALHEALTAAAETVGKGEQYAKGISEYAKAGRAAATWENKIKPLAGVALKRIAQGAGLTAGYETARRLVD